MKLIIDISEGDYKSACKREFSMDGSMLIYNAIRKGTEYKEQPHGEWIPCSERLPEEDGKYLVCWCGAWGVDICFSEYSKCGKYWHEKYGGEYRGITAWMPLPKPFEEGDNK